MKAHQSPPLPLQRFIPLSASWQGILPGIEQNDVCEGMYQIECSMSDALIETLHPYGVRCARLDLVYFGANVYATLYLEAGDWHRQVTLGARMSDHPISAICAKTLRFIKHDVEELG